MKRIVICCMVAALAACVQVEPVSHDDIDLSDSNTGFSAHGSGWVRPRQDWRIDDPYDHLPQQPSALDWPELPVDRIARIQPYMTQDELFSLLGRPFREDVEVFGVDSRDNDYNATVFTWRFQDRRLGTSIERDLEVRLALVNKDRPLPARPEVVGPVWVVLGHDLF